MLGGSPETRVARMLAGAGTVIGFVGLALLGFFSLGLYLPGILFGAFILLVGVVMLIFSKRSKWGEKFGPAPDKPIRRATGIYIVSKFVTTLKYEHVFDPDMFDRSELIYYVQVRFPQGVTEEFCTAPEVFNTIGDGMEGDIVYQGGWLSEFTFVPKSAGQERY